MKQDLACNKHVHDVIVLHGFYTFELLSCNVQIFLLTVDLSLQ